MWLLRLSWKNIWRNRNRSLINMVAVAFAVLLSVVTNSLQEGVFDNLVKNVVGFYSGYIQIHKQGYWDERILDNALVQSSGLERKALNVSNVQITAPRLESFVLASSTELTKGSMVVGVSPEAEKVVTQLADKVTSGSYLSPHDGQVLVAQGLLEKLKLQLRDTIVLIGQGYHGAMATGKYAIKGVLKFGSPELNDQVIFMSLATAQDFFSADGLVTSYVLALQMPDEMDKAAEELRAAVGGGHEVMTWEEMMPEIKQHIQTDKGSMRIIQGILYLLISFGMLGTLLMMMVERKYEMGMLVAIGMKKSKLMQLLLLESVMTVITGCVLGLGLSVAAVGYLHRFPIRFSGEMAKTYQRFGFEPIFPASTEAKIFVAQGLIVLFVGLLLSIYPMLKLWRLNPVTSMKH